MARVPGTDRLPDYVARNRQAWDRYAPAYVEAGHSAWRATEPSWGVWGVPESSLHVLPDVAGKDAVELGCGTAYICAWWARRGAHVVGIDNSPAQLATAQEFQREFGLAFPWIHAAAERVPLPDASADLVISEYGASIWSDPYLWIPEAGRLLRPGGELIFLVNGTVLVLCLPDDETQPATDRLQRSYVALHRVEWPGDSAVEFRLGYGDWIRLLRQHGFEIENLIEIQAPPGAATRYPYVSAQWAQRWPSEELWKARKREGMAGGRTWT